MDETKTPQSQNAFSSTADSFSRFVKTFKKTFLNSSNNRPSPASGSALKQFSFASTLKQLLSPPQFKQDIFGLDIGTSAIKLVQIIHTKNGLELANLWIEELPYTSGASDKQVVKDALKKIISLNNIKGKVISSIGGDAVNIQSVKLPFMPEEEIAKALQWQAQDELSIDIEETAMDYIVLGETDKMGTRQIEVLLIAVPKAIVYDLVNTISELGLNPYAFEPPPLAVVEAFGKDELKAEGQVVGLLELGAGLTNLSIIVDGVLRFTRNIAITSSSLTEDIAEYCKVDKLSAEKLKVRYGVSGLLEGQPAQIDTTDEKMRVSQAMSFKIEKLVSNIDHTLKFYLHQVSNLTNANFDKLLLSGGGALTKGLDKFLSDRLNVPVSIVNPFKKIMINEAKFDRRFLEENAPRFTLSVGLALRKDGF